MPSFANVDLMGYAGKDPESKEVGGKKLVSLSIATSRGSGDNKATDWHSVTLWEKQAEMAMQYIKKGDLVYVEGRLSYNKVGEGADSKIYTQITAFKFTNLTSKSETILDSTISNKESLTQDVPF